MNGTYASSSSSITYPQYPLPSVSNFGTSLPSNTNPFVSPPPTASINPKLSRRHSDYIDQSEQAVSGFNKRASIDYPDISSQHVVRPPPVAATAERHDLRRSGHMTSLSTSEPPRIPVIGSEYPVVYWQDMQVATSGLKNLGNTCYMNSTMQCLSATVPFARFFTGKLVLLLEYYLILVYDFITNYRLARYRWSMEECCELCESTRDKGKID